MTQTLFWVGMVVIALGIGLGYWDLRDRLARIESDLKHLYYELGRHEGKIQSLKDCFRTASAGDDLSRANHHPRSMG